MRIREASEIGIVWTDLKAAHAETFVDAAWDIPPAPLRLSLAAGLSFFGRFRSSYRQASKLLATLIKVPLPRTAQSRIAMVDTLIAVEKARDELKAEDAAMSVMLPVHWRGPKTDFALLHIVSSALYSLATQPVAPRIDSVIEIARQSLAHDYIAELKRLSDATVHAADEVLLALKVNVREAFQVEGRDQIPLRDLLPKFRSGATLSLGSTNGVVSPRPIRAFVVFPPPRLLTRLRQVACLLPPPRPCSIARSPRLFGQKRSQRYRN